MNFFNCHHPIIIILLLCCVNRRVIKVKKSRVINACFSIYDIFPSSADISAILLSPSKTRETKT